MSGRGEEGAEFKAVGRLSPLVENCIGSEGKSVGSLAEVSAVEWNEMCFSIGIISGIIVGFSYLCERIEKDMKINGRSLAEIDCRKLGDGTYNGEPGRCSTHFWQCSNEAVSLIFDLFFLIHK